MEEGLAVLVDKTNVGGLAAMEIGPAELAELSANSPPEDMALIVIPLFEIVKGAEYRVELLVGFVPSSV